MLYKLSTQFEGNSDHKLRITGEVTMYVPVTHLCSFDFITVPERFILIASDPYILHGL